MPASCVWATSMAIPWGPMTSCAPISAQAEHFTEGPRFLRAEGILDETEPSDPKARCFSRA